MLHTKVCIQFMFTKQKEPYYSDIHKHWRSHEYQACFMTPFCSVEHRNSTSLQNLSTSWVQVYFQHRKQWNHRYEAVVCNPFGCYICCKIHTSKWQQGTIYEFAVMQSSLSCDCQGFNSWQGPQIFACPKYPDQVCGQLKLPVQRSLRVLF
jgi:hypothetical protein